MCDYSPFREQAMTVAEDKSWWCDPCIAPIVKALNDAGLRTVASCCGHGQRPGNIFLANGTELTVGQFVLSESKETPMTEYCDEPIEPLTDPGEDRRCGNPEPCPLHHPATRPPRPPACEKCDALWTPGHVCAPAARAVVVAATPAASEPVCRCGHGPDLHYKNGTCFGAYARGCPCTQFDPFSAVMTTDADPRVPVNDEAEAEMATQALRNSQASLRAKKAELEERLKQAIAERDAYRDQSDEDQKARGRLVMELDTLRELASAYLAAWGGGIPKLWHDAFTALGIEAMDDIQAAFDLAQSLAARGEDA